MKYNRSLDLMAAAAEAMVAKKPNTAAKYFAAAVADRSITAALKIIEASNAPAHASMVKAAKLEASKKQSQRARRMRAGLDAAGEPDFEPGEELRVEPDENGDRVVQEADFDEMVGDEDFEDEDVLSSADEDEDDEDDADGDGEGDDEEVEAKVTARRAPAKAAVKQVKTTAAASFAQALRNFEALGKK